MSKKAVIVGLVLLAVGGVAFAMSRQSQAVPVDGGGDAPAVPDAPAYDPAATDWINSIEAWTVQNFEEVKANNMPLPTPPTPAANIAAMQETISKSEGTADKGDPYRVCYGYVHTIASFADHPAVTKEWTGEVLKDSICAGAGLGPGCKSTAAGKYQIKLSTWLGVKAKLGLTDFSPASQDDACVELLRQRGALAPLERGRFADAVYAARKEWASLAGAGYGQGERSIAWLTARFTEAGGVVAA